MGLLSATKLMKNRKKFRWKDDRYKKKALKLFAKSDPIQGKSPPQEYIAKIKAVASRLKGVKGINDLRAHYVGNRIHVEIHIEVDKKISTKTSHDIGKHVQIELEKIQDLDKAFVHIDPV